MTRTQKITIAAALTFLVCFFAGRWTAHAATITTILGTDTISSSRTTINDNFTNLNTDKLETTNLDTFAELDTIVADKSLVNLADNQTFSGLILFTTTSTSTFGGGLRLTGGLSATQGIEAPFFNATSTSASTTLQGLELTRFNTSGTSTLGNGVVFTAGTIKLPSDICSAADNGGVLTTDTDGTIICENDDSTAGGGGAEDLSDLSDASLTSTSTGDILYQASDGLFKNLAIGTGGYLLGSVDGIPGWVATSSFILSEEIDTYSELNTIVSDVTLTHNGLIDTFSEIDTIVADKNLVNLDDAQTFTGLIQFGNTGTSTFGGGVRLTGGLAASSFVETGVLLATSTSASSTVQGITAARLDAQSTSTIAGLRVVSGGLQIQGLDCSGLDNNGTLTTDSSGNVICDPDASSAGGGAEALSNLSDVSLSSTSTGDILYQASDGLFKNLAVGTGGFVLSVVDNIVGWVSTSSFIISEEIDTFSELDTLVADKNLVNLDDTQTFTGLVHFGNTATGTFSGGVRLTGGLAASGYVETGVLLATSTSASSTVQGLTATRINTSATSTFDGGLRITAGGFQVDTLNAASCDLKADTAGVIYCGTDADSGGGGDFPWTVEPDYGVSTTTILGFLNGFITTASSTFSGAATSTFDGNGYRIGGPVDTGSYYNIWQDSADILRIQRTGGSDDSFSLLSILANPTCSPSCEATVNLKLNTDKFIDIYANDYDGASQQYGLRIQKRNSEIYMPLSIDFYDGTTITPGLYISTTSPTVALGNVGIGTTEPTDKLTIVGTSVNLDSAGTATYKADRAATSNFSSFSLYTNGTEQWAFQLRNDSTDDFHIRDIVNGQDFLAGSQGGNVVIPPGFVAQASSTVVGLLNVNSLGVGSSTPTGVFGANGTTTTWGLVVDFDGWTGTSTDSVGSIGHPGCVQYRDVDDSGWTRKYYLNGVETIEVGTCDPP